MTEAPQTNGHVDDEADLMTPDGFLGAVKIVAIGFAAAGTVALAALEISAHKKIAQLKERLRGEQYWPTR